MRIRVSGPERYAQCGGTPPLRVHCARNDVPDRAAERGQRALDGRPCSPAVATIVNVLSTDG